MVPSRPEHQTVVLNQSEVFVLNLSRGLTPSWVHPHTLLGGHEGPDGPALSASEPCPSEQYPVCPVSPCSVCPVFPSSASWGLSVFWEAFSHNGGIRCAFKNRNSMSVAVPFKLLQNGYVKSFKGRFRDECLNEYWFTSLPAARRIVET